MAPDLRGIVTRLTDDFAGKNEVDIIDEFACPFPYPASTPGAKPDWKALDPKATGPEQQQKAADAEAALRQYLTGLIDTYRRAPATTCSPRWPPTTAPTGG